MPTKVPTKAYSDSLPRVPIKLELTESGFVRSFQSGYSKGFEDGYLAGLQEVKSNSLGCATKVGERK